MLDSCMMRTAPCPRDQCRPSPAYQNMVQFLYFKLTTAVLVNRNASSPFKGNGGVTQWCPSQQCSAYLVKNLSLNGSLEVEAYLISPFCGRLNCIPTFAYADYLMVAVPNEAMIAKVLDISDSNCKANGAHQNRQKLPNVP